MSGANDRMSDVEERRRMNDIAVARYIPPVSVPDMQRMAEAVVHSGLFGMKSVPQALTLMWIAQAEGRHPVLAARDYDIIGGRPAKKAEAMLRDFLTGRGAVEWHELTDAVAEATFSHPSGGEVRIRWDMDRARQAGLVGKAGDMWKKYPRQMLRARCTSEGIRTVCPMATSGMYVPEEIGDHEPKKPRGMKDVTPPPEAAPPDLVDPDTGEIFDWDRIARDAREAARRGTQILRDHLRGLPPEARDLLREAVGTAAEPGELLLLARHADADAIRERLRVGEPATPSPAEASPAAPSSPRSEDPAPAGEPVATHRWSVPRRPVARDWELFEDWIGGKLEDGVPGGALRVDNEHALRLLREADPARYEEMQERLTARS